MAHTTIFYRKFKKLQVSSINRWKDLRVEGPSESTSCQISVLLKLLLCGADFLSSGLRRAASGTASSIAAKGQPLPSVSHADRVCRATQQKGGQHCHLKWRCDVVLRAEGRPSCKAAHTTLGSQTATKPHQAAPSCVQATKLSHD